MADSRKNSHASVRQRLLNHAREKGQVFDIVLVNYGLERLLYRLSVSQHSNAYVLKGGLLVTLWTGDANRVTRDADFLGFGSESGERLISEFFEILSQDADDGLVYDVDNLTYQAIRGNQQYGGVRLKTVAYLGGTRIPIVVDIGFGDATIAPDFTIEYPTLLDMPAARIRAYPPASVIAEKFHAIVTLGLVNSRMKDYYDLWAILSSQVLDESELADAIAATFSRRQTEMPTTVPAGLTVEFTADPQKVQQWGTYTASIGLKGLTLETAVEIIRPHLAAACERLRG
jgi:predicted nucleotidyltransferase component of viral defense system